MKSFKKALAVLLSVAMLATMAVPAAAATSPESQFEGQNFVDATVTVINTADLEFDGKGHLPEVEVRLPDGTLVPSSMYTVVATKRWAAGTYKFQVKFINDDQTVLDGKFTIVPRESDGRMFAGTKTVGPKLKLTIGKTGSTKKTIKAQWMKKGARTYRINVSRDKRTALDPKMTKVTYKLVKGPKNAAKYVKIKSNGKVTFRKNAPKGTYKIAVKSAKTANFKGVTKYVTFTIK